MMLEPEQQSDALLLPFLKAADDPASSSAVQELICEFAQPLVGDIIRNKLRVGYSADRDLTDDEAADLISDVILKLVGRLRELKSDPSARAIRNFRGYVAVTSYHACDEYLRKKYPRRYSLKNQLRYVLTHREDFAIWEYEPGVLSCGFAEWKNQEQSVRNPELRELLDTKTLLAESTSAKLISTSLLTAIFKRNGGPLRLDDLVSFLADIFQIKDELQPTSIDNETQAHSDRTHSHEKLESAMDQRSQLEKLWIEICALPPRQRVALLLSLRDSRGRGVLTLLPLIGIASIRQIADTLTMSADSLATLWNQLPVEDAVIASSLGVTRQQVINLRKCARARLLRRVRLSDESTRKARRW
jgi:hypothetical protein